jgi:hypothetical protein
MDRVVLPACNNGQRGWLWMAAGWWAGAPVKGVVDGLAVDGRGNGVGEAFAVMRVDFAWWGWALGPTIDTGWRGGLLVRRAALHLDQHHGNP